MKEANFKETEIGKIPVDWEVKYLTELTDRIGDGIHSTPNYSKDGGYFFINGNNLISGNIKIFEDTKTVNLEEYKIHKRDLSEKTILLSINGTIGNIAIFNNEKVILGKSACYLNLKSIKNLQFIYYILQSNLIQKYFYDNLTGSTIKNLGLGTISNTQIPLPPLAEQEKIAEVLSDTDLWIESTEALLVKKRQIKKAAMQKLLSPKEDWEVRKLGEVCEFFKGKGLPKSELVINGKNKCVHYGELFTKYSENITEILSRTNLSDNVIYSKTNDVLMPTSDVTPRGLATASCINEDGIILGGDILVVRFFENISGLFFAYFITNNKEEVLKYVSGSTVYHLYGSELKNLDFNFPPLKTQQEIAEILSSMDLEIQSLENRLQKARNIKQGMMQDLLTGKVRLG